MDALDRTARRLRRSRAEVVRQAIEYYPDDCEDPARALERLRDPADPELDWDAVKTDLLDRS